jgi:2-iminobutanoate/2-iminopropanoate deaminase
MSVAEKPVPVMSLRAPKPVGPYAQAVGAGGFLFCSGQIGTDPETGELAGVGVAVQAEQAMANLASVLEAAGCGWADVVKVTIYLLEMSEFQTVNEVYARALGGCRPARSTVGVSSLPKGARIEVDAIARLP